MSRNTPSRRRFLAAAAPFLVAPFALGSLVRSAVAQVGADSTLSLPPEFIEIVLRRRRERLLPRPFAPFPPHADLGWLGAGTYQVGAPDRIIEALRRGVSLIDTSPDYRDGETETWVGQGLRVAPRPVFVMTQLPVAAWESETPETAFDRALHDSLRRLGRDRIEVLMVRNADHERLEDPAFRSFAARALASGQVGWIGASGHGPGVQGVLEHATGDPLISVVLFGAHLARHNEMPERLAAASQAGVRLVAMKSREAALWNRESGWEVESDRRRHNPWDPRWDPEFVRRAVRAARSATGADALVLGVRSDADLELITGG